MRDLRGMDPVQVGPYRVIGRLGTGGMGVVYLAEGANGARVALKVVRDDLADDQSFLARFRREVASAQRVGGAYTASLLDADVDADPPWFATEYVAGPTLQQAVAEGERFSEASLRALAVGLAEALAAIHEMGIIHRDLKPSNIILAADGPCVVDFGIARVLDATAMTHSGATLGSPAFMAPEQISGAPQTPATDIFAWAATLVFAATGEGPFGIGEPQALMYRAVHDPPRLSGVDAELEPLLQQALDKDPGRRPTARDAVRWLTGEDRYDTASAVTAVDAGWVPPQTASYAESASGPHRRSGRFLTAVVLAPLLLLLGGAAAWYLTRSAASEKSFVAETAVVPDVTNQSVEAAAGAIEDLGLRFVVRRVTSAQVAPGLVIRQRPAADTDVPVGARVVLTVSTGPEQVEVPSVVGQVAFPVVELLRQQGFDVSISEIASDTVEEGFVMSQDPEGGTSVDVGSTVNLVVSSGPAFLTADLVGSSTDLDPSHWVPSDVEADQRISQRVFFENDWTLVSAFPVTMNGCATRQLRVIWRSVSGPVLPAVADYWDPTVGPILIDREGEQSEEGTMILHGCQQPAFRLVSPPLVDLVVEVSIYQPSA